MLDFLSPSTVKRDLKRLKTIDYSQLYAARTVPTSSVNLLKTVATSMFVGFILMILMLTMLQVQGLAGSFLYSDIVRFCAAAAQYGNDMCSDSSRNVASAEDFATTANAVIGFLRPFGIIAGLMVFFAILALCIQKCLSYAGDWITNCYSCESDMSSFHMPTSMATFNKESFNSDAKMLIRGLRALAIVFALLPFAVIMFFVALRVIETIPVLMHLVSGDYMVDNDSIQLPLKRLEINSNGHAAFEPRHLPYSWCPTSTYDSDTGYCVYK